MHTNMRKPNRFLAETSLKSIHLASISSYIFSSSLRTMNCSRNRKPGCGVKAKKLTSYLQKCRQRPRCLSLKTIKRSVADDGLTCVCHLLSRVPTSKVQGCNYYLVSIQGCRVFHGSNLSKARLQESLMSDQVGATGYLEMAISSCALTKACQVAPHEYWAAKSS